MAINDLAANYVFPICTTLQDASAIVRKNLLIDREPPDLSDQLTVTSMYSGVCSGLKEDDYPVIEGVQVPLITTVKKIPLPPELLEQFGHMQCNCLMGIFPEIGRAWLTVDSDIFVWRYADSDDLAYFDGLTETILSVALVQPKTGIFQERIKYLLVLTTPLDIVLLGVSFLEDDINNEMHLLPEPLFSISSDNSYLLHSVGTLNGRIFTAGKDGCLYEITYQAKQGWFSRRCVKVNHSRSRLSYLLPSMVSVWLNEDDSISQICVDDTRNILYTRSEKGTLSVYDLGEDGNSTSCVAQLRLDSIQRKARDIASGIEPSNLNELIYIAPITRRESRHIHLVAVTQAGVRLYFMTGQAGGQGTLLSSPGANISKLRPSGIYLVHVRLPPGFTGHSLQRPTGVHAAHYNAGTLLLSSSCGDDGMLWCVSKDTFPFNKQLKETHKQFALDGRAWAISEVASPYTDEVAAVLPFGCHLSIPPDPPMQVIQHVQKPSEYVVVTSQGCHLFSKTRPIDQLRSLLEQVADPECTAVEAFFKLYENGEAACCCIILAMSKVPTDVHIGEKAVVALVYYGGLAPRPLLAQQLPTPFTHPPRPQPVGPMSPIPQGLHPQQVPQTSVMRTPSGIPVISTPMPGHHPPMSVTPVPYPGANVTMQQGNNTMATAPAGAQTDNTAVQTIYYSERQQGAFKLFSRIARPLWEGKLVEDYLVEEDGKRRIFVVSRLDIDVVTSVLDQLNSFKAFIGKNCLTQIQLRDLAYSSRDYDVIGRSSFLSQQAPAQTSEQHRARLAEIARAELTSMKCLYDLILRSCEVLGLWRILLHHQIHVLFEALDKPSQATLRTITFQDLVLSGEAVCTSLVSTLINQFMDDNVTIDALNSQLREVCPSLYSADDATYSKASELLHMARKSTTTLKEDHLRRASQLFQQIAGSVNLAAAMQQFIAVRSYTEAVELCIKAAQAKDENNLALKLYHSGLSANHPQVDPVMRKSYLARMECYKYITDMLDDLTNMAESPSQTPSVPVSPGPPRTSQPSTSSDQTPEEIQTIADNCLQLAIQSNDELLHVTLYAWLLRKGLASQLLQINSPFIEPFLCRIADTRDESPAPVHSGVDLLWQHHERTGQHLQAAQVLLNLAEKPGPDRDLNRRIEYLSRAKVNAKSITSAVADSTTGGALLHDIEEKLEVAQIQLEILNFLRDIREGETVAKLNSNLYDVTALYTEFAEPYQLAECKLSIAHCSGLNDDSLIKALWKNIIEDEIAKCDPAAESTVAATLKTKVIQLGRRYLSSRRYFPIDHIAVSLEMTACSRKWDVEWVFTTLIEVGVSISDVFDTYVNTHAHKLPYWASYSKPYHLLWVQNEIIRVFLDDPAKYMPSVPNRRRFVNYLLDSIAANLVQLRSITSPSHDVTELISLFQRMQAALEALQEKRP